MEPTVPTCAMRGALLLCVLCACSDDAPGDEGTGSGGSSGLVADAATEACLDAGSDTGRRHGFATSRPPGPRAPRLSRYSGSFPLHRSSLLFDSPSEVTARAALPAPTTKESTRESR